MDFIDVKRKIDEKHMHIMQLLLVDKLNVKDSTSDSADFILIASIAFHINKILDGLDSDEREIINQSAELIYEQHKDKFVTVIISK